MQKNIKYKLLIILCAALLFSAACFSMALATTDYKTAAASEIDYVNQNYVNIHTNDYMAYDYPNEDIVYKIHCPDVSDVAKETYYEISGMGFDGREYYSTQVVFHKLDGYIIFEKGVPGLIEENKDPNKPFIPTDELTEYYDILYYDELNETVYIKYKNLDELEASYSTMYADPNISQRITEYVNIPQKTSLLDIYNSIAENVFYFDADATQSDDLGKLYFRFNYNSEAITGKWLIDKITISFDTEDGQLDGCEIDKTDLTNAAFDAINETTGFVDIEVSVDDFLKSVALKAVVEFSYGEDKFVYEYKSLERSIFQIWENMESAGALEDNYGPDALFSIQHYLAAYNGNFNAKANSATYLQLMPEYDENTALNDYRVINSSYIYRFPSEENFEFYLKISSDEFVGDVLFTFDAATRVLTNNNIYSIAKDCNVWLNNEYLYFSFFGVSDWAHSEVIIRTRTPIVSAAIAAALSTDYENELLAQIEEWKQKFEEEAAKSTQITAELNAYKAEIIQLNEELTELRASLLSKQNEIHNLTAEKERLEKQLAEKEYEITTLKNSLNATTNNYNAAAADLEKLTAEYNQLKEDYDTVCAAQDGDTKAMISTINDYRAKIVEKEKKIKELQDAVNELQSENEQLQNQKGTISMGCSGNIGDGGTLAVSMTAMIVMAAIILWRRAYARKKK